MFQVTCPSALRHAETRILAEEPRLATAAVGTSRQGRVVIRHLGRGLDRSVPSVRSMPPRGLPYWAVARCRPASPGSRAPRRDLTALVWKGARARSIGPCESLAAGRAEGSAEELNARQPLDAPRVGVAVFPAESHMGFIHAENPCVADRRPKDVPRQIAQHGVVIVAVVLAEGHPLPFPDDCRDVLENGRRCGLQGRAKLARRSCGKGRRPARGTLPEPAPSAGHRQ